MITLKKQALTRQNTIIREASIRQSHLGNGFADDPDSGFMGFKPDKQILHHQMTNQDVKDLNKKLAPYHCQASLQCMGENEDLDILDLNESKNKCGIFFITQINAIADDDDPLAASLSKTEVVYYDRSDITLARQANYAKVSLIIINFLSNLGIN